jgi:hypothetical protein
VRRPKLVALAAAVALGVGVAAVLAAKTRSSAPATPAAPDGPLRGELTGRAPWPANTAYLRERLATLGLPALAQEGTKLHIHQHLDVFVRGRRVVVPAGIGIDPNGRFISPIHTHDMTGVIHVESPTVRMFTLGEFFGVWGVRFGKRCLGSFCTGRLGALRVYADGRPVARPWRLPLAEHQEIVVAFGTRSQLPRPIPAQFAFAPGV